MGSAPYDILTCILMYLYDYQVVSCYIFLIFLLIVCRFYHDSKVEKVTLCITIVFDDPFSKATKQF